MTSKMLTKKTRIETTETVEEVNTEAPEIEEMRKGFELFDLQGSQSSLKKQWNK
jgi:hypothetical protein